jgi:hypothetical protein
LALTTRVSKQESSMAESMALFLGANEYVRGVLGR